MTSPETFNFCKVSHLISRFPFARDTSPSDIHPVLQTKSYRDLHIYQESKKLAIEIHKMSLKLPRFETYEEGSQVRRSSKAVTVTIVEGYGRKRYKADLIKHLVIAHTECDETREHLDFLFETESLKDAPLYNKLTQANEMLSKKIYRLILWVEKNWE